MSLAGCEGPWDADPVPSLTCNMRAAEAAAPLLGLLSAQDPGSFPFPSLFDVLTEHNNLSFAWSHIPALFQHILSSATQSLSP